jgi:signal transduction histidine kinase
MSAFSSIRGFWKRSITRRMALHIMLLHVVLMVLFMAFVVQREVRFLNQLTESLASALAHTLAANSGTWAVSRDLSGVPGLLHSLDEFPFLEEAMLLDTQGRILAHTRAEEAGKRLPEVDIRKFVNHAPRMIVLQHDWRIIDMVAPVLEGDMLIGWARVRVNTIEARSRLREMMRHALWFILVALALSGCVSWYEAKQLTGDIYRLAQLSKKIQAGQHQERLDLPREDELGQLARDFNQMLDTLDEQGKQLNSRTAALARSNAELERFAYIASHDLQEPLRMVTSYVQLLARRYQGKLDEDADVFIGFAVNGAQRMQQLINDLLSYSRVDSRGGDFSLAPLDETLDAALFALRMSVLECDARIQRVPLPTLPVDAGQMELVWQNLIGNALKFRDPERAPLISIGAEEKDDHWRFSVSDNGIGIEAGQEERIFQIFQRLHSREEYPGTGIGLSIVKRIVERHGGGVGVVSRQGQGAEFWFTLPGHPKNEA